MLLSVCLLTMVMMGGTQAKSYLPIYTQPEQIHIAFGDDPSQMWIVWNTRNNTSRSAVQYMAKGGKAWQQTEGVSRLFTDGGLEHRKQYIHRVKLTHLNPGVKYVYRCGSDEGWSEKFTFTAMQSGNKWSPRFAVYGDMGNENPQSLPRLQQEAEDGHFDAVLHVGDFAYDFFYDNGRVGDEFMRQIEPIAANVPYMTCPGNHEMRYNFSNYKHRFVMPGDELTDKMFYSFNIGPAHIISFSTEFYYYFEYGIIQPIEQFKWLEKDLQEANKPENRAQQPWIITMGHRPMYCSNSDGDDCTNKDSRIRTGLPLTHGLALEPLFYKYGVDLEIWAHEHSYERLWPVYDRKVYNGSVEQPYTNPRAPVHIITGSAGCHDYLANFTKNVADWSAFHIKDYGYSRMTIHNATHLYFEQVSNDKGGKVIDSIWIKASKHGPFGAVRYNTQTQWRSPDHDRFNPPQRNNNGYLK